MSPQGKYDFTKIKRIMNEAIDHIYSEVDLDNKDVSIDIMIKTIQAFHAAA